MQTKYRVIIAGLLPDASNGAKARANLSRLLKAPPEKIDRLLASLPFVIKKNVDRETGLKYHEALMRAGVLVEIRAEKAELSLERADERAPEAAPSPSCPQCGASVQQPGKCPACVEKNRLAREQASTAKQSRRRERNEKIRQSAVAMTINWARGNIWKAAIVFVLVPFFGGSFLVSTVFYTQDKHLVYQTLSSRTVCVRDPSNILSMHSNTDKDLFGMFHSEFNDEEIPRVLEKWNNEACRAIYEMELGNIGEQPVTSNIEFATWRFVKGSGTGDIRVQPKFRNLSSSSRREQDPVVKQTKGVLTLENIYPNTHVTLRFGGWIDGKGTALDWENMLTGITVDDGVVEVGDPLATAFGRLLTVFF